MRSSIHLISIAALLTIGMAFCASPTEPDSIWDIDREGESLWFVLNDHTTMTDEYRIGRYAYVTILDLRTFWRDILRSCVLISDIKAAYPLG